MTQREKGERIGRGIKLKCPKCKRAITVYSKSEVATCTAHGLEMKPERG